MPLKRCTEKGKSGWKWGDSGKCYIGEGGRAKALAQGQAIEAGKRKKDHSMLLNIDKIHEIVKKGVNTTVSFVFNTDGDSHNTTLKTTASEDSKTTGVDVDVDVDVPLNKTFLEKGLVYGVVYAPNEVDAHGHFADPEMIMAAAHDFFIRAKLNKNHAEDLSKEQVVPVESYIAPVDFTFEESGESVTKGTWFIVVKVLDEELKKEIEDGELAAFSLEGEANLVEVE